MPRNKNDLTDTLVAAPFWVSLIFATVAYIYLKFFLPVIAFQNPLIKIFASIGANLAPWVTLFFIFLSVLSFVRGRRITKQYEQQMSVDTLNELSWKEFEDVTGEYFRRQGYSVEENLRAGADGGVDLRLRKNGRLTLVQCKRWKKQKVTVSTVRELIGSITVESAHFGTLVSTSAFTADAKNLAHQQGIKLIDGHTLIASIGQIQGTAKKVQACTNNSASVTASASPLCPQCEAVMVLRTAKKGQNAGNQFWGCSSFPKCKGTLNVT